MSRVKNVPLMKALAIYGATIKELGWEAGEGLIAKYSEQFLNFREMAWAVGVVLRAEEIETAANPRLRSGATGQFPVTEAEGR